MQRLYTMFPAGAPGIALLILRLASAFALLESAWRHPPFAALMGTLAILALPGGALCLGAFTPYASTISCLIEVALLVRSGAQPEFPVIISVMITAALGVLGPGAYSLDAHIFGWRIISFPTPGKKL